MLCVLFGQITRCCANRFQDFPFSLASICTVSVISKLKAGSILKVKVASPELDAILVAIFFFIVMSQRLFCVAPSLDVENVLDVYNGDDYCIETCTARY